MRRDPDHAELERFLAEHGEYLLHIAIARHQAFADAPASQFPRVVAAAATMASNVSAEQYLWGLRRLLDGITTSQGTDPKSATARRSPHR